MCHAYDDRFTDLLFSGHMPTAKAAGTCTSICNTLDFPSITILSIKHVVNQTCCQSNILSIKQSCYHQVSIIIYCNLYTVSSTYLCILIFAYLQLFMQSVNGSVNGHYIQEPYVLTMYNYYLFQDV